MAKPKKTTAYWMLAYTATLTTFYVFFLIWLHEHRSKMLTIIFSVIGLMALVALLTASVFTYRRDQRYTAIATPKL